MTIEADLVVVNVVGVGDIGLEIDLGTVSTDIEAETKYNPESYPGLYIRFPDSDGLLTLYRTGKYHIVGVDSEEDLFEMRERFVTNLQNLGIKFDEESDSFGVRNYVCTTDYGRNIDLNRVAILLGLERIEYEPEQFPGLVYQPEEENVTILVFSSGKCVITGARSLVEANAAKVRFSERLISELDKQSPS